MKFHFILSRFMRSFFFFLFNVEFRRCKLNSVLMCWWKDCNFHFSLCDWRVYLSLSALSSLASLSFPVIPPSTCFLSSIDVCTFSSLLSSSSPFCLTHSLLLTFSSSSLFLPLLLYSSFLLLVTWLSPDLPPPLHPFAPSFYPPVCPLLHSFTSAFSTSTFSCPSSA